MRKKVVQNGFIISSPRYLFEFIAVLIIISISLLFSNENGIQYKSLSYLATFALGAQKILPLIQTIYRMISNIRSKKFEVIDIIKMMNSKVIIYPKIKKIYKFKDSIKLLNVNFAYDAKIIS